jgi:hypothetical protein
LWGAARAAAAVSAVKLGACWIRTLRTISGISKIVSRNKNY